MAIRVIIRPWLARKHNISMEMEGVIQRETRNAILFSGQGFAEERVHCMRCSRQLTHPSSRLVGFGPICCGHLGIHWPTKDVLTPEELQAVRAKIAEIRWEGWLPKSQIEIVGEYTIEDTPAPAGDPSIMGSLVQDGILEGVYVKSPYKHKEKCQTIRQEFGGRWNGVEKRWEYPLKAEVIHRGVELWGDSLTVESTLQEWIEGTREREEALLGIKDAGDAQVGVLGDVLYDFQRVGVSFLTRAGRAILGDDMGLGKTLQAIAACEELGAERVLVICPNTLKGNWEKEILKWIPDASVQVVHGSRAKRVKQLASSARYTIINYEALRLHREELSQDWDVAILDEAHRIKNRDRQVSRAAFRIAKKAKHVYHLTGTPIMNRPEEIWSLLHAMFPGEYASYWGFVREHCHLYNNGFGTDIGNVKDPQKFRDMLAPLMLRRKKEEVLEDLPSRTLQKYYVQLKGRQGAAYRQMEKDMAVQLSTGEMMTASMVLARITRLKQIAVSPELVGVEGPSAKLDVMMDIINDAGDQKVVVFSQFAEAIKLAAGRLTEAGIGHAVLIGETRKEDREAGIERFQNDPACRVFLASIQAGGLGITLTAGSIGIFLDKHWTPAINNQAADRLHRIGQERPVTIYEILAEGSIEEWIEELLEEKKDTFDSLIEGRTEGDTRRLFNALRDRLGA